MRVLIWHGWTLEGSGSNVYTARIAEVLRAGGHDVALVCQEPHAERYAWIDATAVVGADGPAFADRAVPAPPSSPGGSRAGVTGRCVLLRPAIGNLLPAFVVDRYEGFGTVRRFVDLSEAELHAYLSSNVEALRATVAWHDSELVIAGHAVPGAVIASRAAGPGRYVVKIHGSDLEYAIRPQERYRELAREGLSNARAVVGGSRDVLDRCRALVPEMGELARVISPGVDAGAFRPRPRRDALVGSADRLDADRADADRGNPPGAGRDGASGSPMHGRPPSADAALRDALARRDLAAIDAIGASYDQGATDQDASAALRRLARTDRPIVGYLGKLIPAKGVEQLLEARAALRLDPIALIVGFGSHRERLAALAIALADGDADAVAWLHDVERLDDGARPPAQSPDRGVAIGERGGRGAETDDLVDDVVFTGRLDHRYAPGAVAAMDVLVVPSVLEEAFGMVAAEGAAAGALPLVARHSGLAEVAEALEAEVGHPGLFSFAPGAGAVTRLEAGLEGLLSFPAGEREELRHRVSVFAAATWSWERTAEELLYAGI